MNRSLCITMLFCCALTLAGCSENPGSTDDSQAAEFLNTTWRLQSIVFSDSTIIQDDSNKTFNIRFFEDLHLRGINDCNEYFGIYTISDNNSLSLDSLGTSFAGCGESIDREYYRVLHFVHSYEISNNRLQLYYDESNSTLNFLKSE